VAKPQFDIDGQQVAMNYPVMLGSDEVAAKFGGFLGYPDSFVISKDVRWSRRLWARLTPILRVS